MRLQFRFLFLYLFLIIAAASILVAQKHFDLNRSQSILKNELTQQHAFFDQIVNLEGRSIQTLAADYTYWDDMVNFVHDHDQQWAQDNIDPALKEYDADVVFVYDINGNLVYRTGNASASKVTDLGLPKSYYSRLYADRTEHFFIFKQFGLLEIQAATIHPTTDEKRETTPQGYFLVGKLWTDDYLKHLGTITQTQLKYTKPSEASIKGTIGTDSISFGEALDDYQGLPIAELHATVPVQAVKDLEDLYTRQLGLLGVFAAASLVVAVVYIYWLVIRPVRIIDRSIKRQKPHELDYMALASDNEFGELATTVQSFFSQKVQIATAEYKEKQLQELNKQKEEFLAVAAHELNSPAANVKIFAENLGERIKEGANPEEIARQIERITHQVKRMGILIRDLRLVSKGDSQMEMQYRDFDFDHFMVEEVAVAQFSTSQKLNLLGATQKRVVSDTDRLSQVVNNLIKNANKYSPEADHVDIHLSSNDYEIRVEVQDFGIGMSPEDMSHIFKKFYRSQKVADTFPGLGLGLAISKDIVEKLGGHIWVESELGKGSRFYFVLPIDPSKGLPSAPNVTNAQMPAPSQPAIAAPAATNPAPPPVQIQPPKQV